MLLNPPEIILKIFFSSISKQFVDYLTGEFLEEQYKGQRDLAGKISTLGKMVKAQGAATADFLFDKQLL